MPNWCLTSYKLVGDEKEINELFETISGLIRLKHPSVPNDFGSNWLGCLVVALGADWHNVRCRGEIMDVTLEDGILNIATQSAWAPCNEVFDLLVKKYPSISYYYFAEEEGNELYETNDVTGTVFPERFVLDVNSRQTEWTTEYFKTAKAAYKWLERTFGCTIRSWNDIAILDDDLSNENEDYYVHIYPVNVIK